MSKYLTEEEIAALGNGVYDACIMMDIMAYYPIDLQPLAVLYRTDRFEENGHRNPHHVGRFPGGFQAADQG